MSNLEPGMAIPSLKKVVYQRKLDEFKYVDYSVHSDEHAKSKGYPGPLVSAYVITGYISELLLKYFGPTWIEHGKYSAKFIGKGLQQGDNIVCCGTIRERKSQGSGAVEEFLDIWIEKDGGTKAVVGEASCLVASRPMNS